MTLDKAVALVATHFGEVDENRINDMSFVFFEEILEELGRKLTYEAVVNYAGNGFCEKSWDMITENNPMNIAEGGTGKRSGSTKSIASFLESADVVIMKKDKVNMERNKGVK